MLINSMKRVANYSVLFLLFNFLLSCSGDSPKSVAEDYLKAFNRQNYEKAKDYATDDTKKLLDMFISLAALTPDSMKRNLNFSVVDEKIVGDTAYVNYKTEGSTKVQTLTLRKIAGKWKVAATKDTINELEGGELMDTGATNTDTSVVDEKFSGDSLTE